MKTSDRTLLRRRQAMNEYLEDEKKVSRESSATKILSYVARLHDRSEMIAKLARKKFTPYCISEAETPPSTTLESVSPNCPPFFAELTSRLNRLERNLESLELTINKCDL